MGEKDFLSFIFLRADSWSSLVRLVVFGAIFDDGNSFLMKSNGHWFCDHCDDVVFMTYQNTSAHNVPCPACGHLACNFVPARLSRKILPAEWFEEMRRIVSEAATPELSDQRHHFDLRK